MLPGLESANLKTLGREASRWGRFFSLAALVSGCATVRSGQLAMPLDASGKISKTSNTPAGLRISGEEIGELSSRYFGVLELTFENTSTAWVRIQRIGLDFGGESVNRSVFVPWGSDIEAWKQATLQRNAIRDANRAATLALLAIGGASVARLSTNEPAAAFGGLVALGAVAGLAGHELNDSIRSAEHVAIFPDSHLLSVPFAVPPGLFTKKWILLNTEDRRATDCLVAVTVSYELRGRAPERVLLRFRDPWAGSEWQKTACTAWYAARSRVWNGR